MKMRFAVAALVMASIMGIVSLSTYPAQSQLRPTPATPTAPSPAPAAPKLTVPANPQINAAPAPRDKMSPNPQGNPSSFDVKKDEAKKTEAINKQKAADARDEARDKAAAKKKKEIEKNAAAAAEPAIKKKQQEASAKKVQKEICTASCKTDPCSCGKQFMPVTVLCQGVPNCFTVVDSKDTERNTCMKTCTKSTQTCQKSC